MKTTKAIHEALVATAKEEFEQLIKDETRNFQKLFVCEMIVDLLKPVDVINGSYDVFYDEKALLSIEKPLEYIYDFAVREYWSTTTPLTSICSALIHVAIAEKQLCED